MGFEILAKRPPNAADFLRGSIHRTSILERTTSKVSPLIVVSSKLVWLSTKALENVSKSNTQKTWVTKITDVNMEAAHSATCLGGWSVADSLAPLHLEIRWPKILISTILLTAQSTIFTTNVAMSQESVTRHHPCATP